MNEHLEYFKRFANCYLKWSHSNFDRIVKDAVRRQELIRLEEIAAKERLKYKPIIDMYKITNEIAKKWLAEDRQYKELFEGSQWPIGTKLKIKLPDGGQNFKSLTGTFLPSLRSALTSHERLRHGTARAVRLER